MIDLDAIEARVNAATPGPWKAVGWGGITDGDGYCLDDWDQRYTPEDAAFIAHAREDIPALVAEVRRLRKLAAVVGELYDFEASGFGENWPEPGSWWYDIRELLP